MFLPLKMDPGNPDRMVVAEGSSGLSLAGLLLMVVGVSAALSMAGLFPRVDVNNWLVGGGAVAAIVIGFWISRCSEVSVDRRRQVLERWTGILGRPFKGESHPFRGAVEISIGRELREDGYLDTLSVILYPVRIGHLLFEEGVNYPEALLAARTLAHFLSLPLVDRSLGAEAVTLAADEVDFPLVERMRRQKTPPPPLASPPAPRSIESRDAAGLVVRFPPPGMNAKAWQRLRNIAVAMLPLQLFHLVPLFRTPPLPEPDIYMVSGAMVLVLTLLPLAWMGWTVWMRIGAGRQVAVGKSGIRLTEGCLLWRTRVIPAESLVELRVNRPATVQTRSIRLRLGMKLIEKDLLQESPPFILALGEDRILKFGHGLAEAELAFRVQQMKVAVQEGDEGRRRR